MVGICVAWSMCGTVDMVFALGDSATRFNIFVPPNNAYSSRRSILVVTNSSAFSNTVTIQDDAADGDSDDSATVTLERGQSYIVKIAEGTVNDDFGGKVDGDYMRVTASHPVTVHMATESNWQHDWGASTGKSGIGHEFFVYAPPTSGADNDINVYAYHDHTQVSVTEISTQATQTGYTQVDLTSVRQVLNVELDEGEDLIVRENRLGLDILDPGHTYWVQASHPVTVQYGHLGQVTGGNQARDGGGFVPSANGSATGSLYYFFIPHNPGLASEKELRVACFDDNTTVQLSGASSGGSNWTVIDESTVHGGGHLDFVGAHDAEFRSHALYRLTVSPAHHRCTVFEGNWMETGSYGTSDFASTLSGDNGRGVANVFVAYVGPPGRQDNVVNPEGESTNMLSPSGGYASHLYVYSGLEETQFTVSDVDTAGSIFDETFLIPANGYYDVVIDQSLYSSMSSSDRRPYVQIAADKPIMVISGNFNDNWMTHFNSVQAPEPQLSVDSGESTLSCGQTSTLSIDCTNGLNTALLDVSITVELPEGTSLVSASGSPAVLNSTVTWDAGTLAPGALENRTLTIQRDCTTTPCIEAPLSPVVVECGSGSGSGPETYHSVSSLPLGLLSQAPATVTTFSATDNPNYDSGEANANVGISLSAFAAQAGTSLTLTRASDSGDSDAPQTILTTFELSTESQTFQFADTYPIHYEQTRYYRLTTSDSGCSQTVGPVAVQTSSGVSGGEESGLESHGKLSQQMARRAIMRARRDGSAEQQVGRFASRLTDEGPLAHLVPEVGPELSAPINATPGDLPALTNATRVSAVDYLDAVGRQVASMLLIETRGEVYEHQKALCDRAHGSRMDAVRLVHEPEGNLIQMASSHDEMGMGEYAVDVKLYKEQGGYTLHSSWLRGDYPSPAPNQEVINIQIWSMYPGYELSLLSQFLHPLEVHWGQQDPPPEGYFTRGTAGFGDIALQLAPDVQSLSKMTLRTTRTTEQQDTVTEHFPLAGRLRGGTEIELNLAPFVDITVELLDRHGRAIDNLWLSDGAWTTLTDNIREGHSQVHATNFLCPESPHTPSGLESALSGCGSVRGHVDQWMSVVRHLASGALDGRVERSGEFSFELNATAAVTVCLESPTNNEAGCLTVDATAGVPIEMRLPTAGLRTLDDCSSVDLVGVELVSFTIHSPGTHQLSVRHLTFHDRPQSNAGTRVYRTPQCDAPRLTAPTSSKAAGCQIAPANLSTGTSGLPWLLAWAAGVRRLRKRRNPLHG